MHTLTYFSRSLLSENTRETEMHRLMSASREHNLSLGITSVLCLRGDIFYHTLEGPKDEVLRVFNSIKSDKRHDSVYLIMNEPIEERRFSSWAMECFYQPECDDDLLASLEKLGSYLFKHGEFSPSAVYIFSWKMVAELAAFRLSTNASLMTAPSSKLEQLVTKREPLRMIAWAEAPGPSFVSTQLST
ncbi:BLUF domain-containing protein [Rhodobacteraceae bacterium]|nr:BLUF domain-containing protein [Paracoccaceae bacterium]